MLIGLILILIGAFYFIKFMFLVVKAVYYRFFANERQLDNELMSQMKRTSDYKDFEKGIDKLLN